jgi:hypothetical protein
MKKKVMGLFVLVLLALPALSQNLVSSFIEKIDSDSQRNAMKMSISGKMLRFAVDRDADADKEMKELIKNIDKISMVAGLSIDEKQKKTLNQSLKSYEELMSIEEEFQTIQMFTKENKGKVEEFVLIIWSDDELVLMSITGKIDLNQLSRLSESVNIQGMEHLERIDNKKIKK